MGRQILVVDDDQSIRLSISVALKMRGGFEMLQAEDGFQGFELAKQHIPDLIISDVVMDKLNGFELLDKLQKCPETSHIPVIIMTYQAQTAKGWKTGAAVEYLAKGFSLDTLLEKVNSILKIQS
jgi:DNA-binding response OmpR family regulator